MPNLWLVFTTGLLTGGLTCMAVQGSLLATSLLTLKQKGKLSSPKNKILALGAFLSAKLLSYILLGALLGWFGSFFTISINFQITMTLLVVVFMLGSAANMLDLHPIFRYFSLSPPRVITRFIRAKSKSDELVTPFILGLLTVLIPCGTTQAMMVLAVGSGNPIGGAMTMGTFVLGTIPVFFALGYGVSSLGDVFQNRFRTIAATLIILLALWNLNTALTQSGTKWTFQGIGKEILCTVSFCDNPKAARADSQAVTEATIYITSRGYEVDNPVLKAGAKIALHVKNTDGSNCAQAFTIPDYGIQKFVPVGESVDFEITAPASGNLSFMCSMGMYRGEFLVK